MNRAFFQRFLIFFLLLFLCLFPQKIFAQEKTATYTLETPYTNIPLNTPFVVQVYLNTNLSEVNTVHLELTYPSDYLNLSNVSFTASTFPNIVEKDIRNPGVIKLTAYTINPSKGNNRLVTELYFNSKKTGKVEVDVLSTSKVHLADGLGTDIFNFDNSQRLLAVYIKTTDMVGGRASLAPGASGSPTGSQTPTIAFSEPKNDNPIEAVSSFINNLKRQASENVVLGETGVVDFTKSPREQLKHSINQLFSGKIKNPDVIYYIIIGFLVILGGSIALLLVITIRSFMPSQKVVK